MKKLIFLAIFLFFILAGCSPANQNTVLTAEISEVLDSGLLITTSDDIGFDKAYVLFNENLHLSFTPAIGQTIQLEILPEIRESYPVQVTAVQITLMAENEKPSFVTITSAQAKEMMKDDVVILDVRTQSEYDESHIPGAILIPYDEIISKISSVLPDKNKTILVYCRTGRRSALASQTLIDMGYMHVYDFGGIVNWEGETVTN